MPKHKKHTKTAASYARYSSDNQSEESIQAQLRACREYAERNKLIRKTYARMAKHLYVQI